MTLDVTTHLVPVFWGLVAFVLVSTALFVAAALGAWERRRQRESTQRGGLTGPTVLRHTTRAVRSIG